MNEKEYKIQKALGTLKTYAGFVSSCSSYVPQLVYKISALTLDDAWEQAQLQLENDQKESKYYLELVAVTDIIWNNENQVSYTMAP